MIQFQEIYKKNILNFAMTDFDWT